MSETSDYTLPVSKLVASRIASAETQKRYAILVSCGSYNPIHCAHVAMMHEAKHALESSAHIVLGAYVSPVNDGYGKAGLASFSQRAAVCDAMLQDDDLVMIDRWEGLQPEYVRSYYVLCHVRDAVLQHYGSSIDAARVDVYLVCGGDLFETFYRPNCWKLSLLRKIFDEFRLAVAYRSGSQSPTEVLSTAEPITSTQEPGESLDLRPYASKVVVFELPPNTTSSTLIRDLIGRGESIPQMLMPECAAAVLADLGMYLPATA
jgi:nicotinamide mononucleotide adenylyltransferase